MEIGLGMSHESDGARDLLCLRVPSSLQVDSSVAVCSLVDAVHGLEDRLLALPFHYHDWSWK